MKWRVRIYQQLASQWGHEFHGGRWACDGTIETRERLAFDQPVTIPASKLAEARRLAKVPPGVYDVPMEALLTRGDVEPDGLWRHQFMAIPKKELKV